MKPSNERTADRGRLGRWAWMAAGAAALLLAGCSVIPQTQPDLTRFFVLSSPPPKSETATAPTVDQRLVRVVLRPVTVPEFLRSRIMPVRVGETELRFVDEARWAEPLEAALTRVIGDQLAQSTGLRLFERRGEEHDYEVTVRVSHCEGVLPAGVARLVAHIEIYSAGLDQALVEQAEFAEDVRGWDGKDHGVLAQKLSEATAALGGRIAEMLITKTK